MTSPLDEGATPRTVSVQLSQDSVLDAADGSRRVVVNHGTDESGSLFVYVSDGGEVRRLSIHEVLAQQSAEYRRANPIIAPDPHTEYLNWIDKSKISEAFELQRNVLDVLEGRSGVTSSRSPVGAYDPETTTEAQRRKTKATDLEIHPTTLGRHINAFRAEGLWGLVPHASRALRRSGAKKVSPEILAVVRHWARDRHLSSKKSLVNEHALVLDELRRHGLVTATPGTVGADGKEIPHEHDALSYDAFKRLIRHLNRGRDPRTAKTRQQQSNRPVVNDVRHRGYDFGDRLEFDATKTDILLWSEDGPVPAWAVFGVCVSTRYPWVRLVPGPPKGVHLGLLLWDIMGGETLATGQDAKSTEALWAVPTELSLHAWRGEGPTGILPGAIAVDHGAEEENSHFISLCAQLGITLLWARTMNPTDKAFIESLIRKFASACELLPGHKGNTVENRPHRLDADLPTFEQVRRAFQLWSHWVANQPHTGLAHNLAAKRFLTPNEAVNISHTRGVPLRVLADPTLHLRLLPYVQLTPQDDGITWEKRRYTAPGYDDLITASLGRTGRREPLTFYYDPDAKHRLWWPETGGTFRVRSLSAPGPDSGVTPSFADVRDVQLKNLSGHKWLTHNETSSRRADFFGLVRKTWEADGLGAKIVPIRKAGRAETHAERRAKGTDEVFDNRGWDLSEFIDLVEKHADDFDDNRPSGGDGSAD